MQASFRRDLKLVLEAAGVKGVKLVLSDDSRFIDTVILSHPVRKARSLQAMCQRYLGDLPFPLACQRVGDVVDFD